MRFRSRVEHPLGSIVGRTASERFKKVSLELGGKNATVVFDDCDVEKAVEGAVRAGFANQGQVCLCGSRLLVQKGFTIRLRLWPRHRR